MFKKIFTIRHIKRNHLKAKLSSPKKTQIGKGSSKKACDYCGSLVDKYYLQSHINRVHLNIKPSKTVKCTDCDATFETSQSRDRHMNSIHLKVRTVLIIGLRSK